MNWKPIPSYEDYEVSDTGLVRSLRHGRKRILSLQRNLGGYLQVTLCKNGKAKNMFVHRLVAAAFIQNPLGLATVNHRDENKTNNQVENLEWLTQADNVRYSMNKRSKSKPVVQFDKLGNVVGQFSSMSEAERQTGISVDSICMVCRGRRKTAGGFVWKYTT